ncbi:6-pyruvoyl trahydropterin synthase family protein [Halomonas huangheensis]|uniref:6-carboxy-5,6,7,8-tetrahydropterin synthase n=1 Tax=Halomonas huangheensis TaxID=1178482 RepID=W1NB10_9GAMM|nr:6-carboxytetrahydropterin synthase [Halomonas huangheensis]ALM52749.1 6-pyruvoyl tetrahydropterin synthase-related protein [Halomonas huangheensis]ERL52714.1 hypothetical protein BJB45_15655 [Halomonas huangheensis]
MSLFVNQLTHLDVSLWCPDKGLVGASWHLDAELFGELGEDGMLFDFGEVKPWIKSRIDAGADHTLLVPGKAPGVDISDCPEGMRIRMKTPYPMEVRGPRQAFTILPCTRIDTDNLAEHLTQSLGRRFPERVERIVLRLREEVIDGASYRYSHGLKRHAGNCQRIAHGHRSRLTIFQNGERQPHLESHYAAWLDNSYLVSAEDIVAEGGARDATLSTAYRSAQGQFHLTLPRERCRVLASATTVENIAIWLTREITRATGVATQLHAFEGIDKGACYEIAPEQLAREA